MGLFAYDSHEKFFSSTFLAAEVQLALPRPIVGYRRLVNRGSVGAR